jgi:hypothetical protein
MTAPTALDVALEQTPRGTAAIFTLVGSDVARCGAYSARTLKETGPIVKLARKLIAAGLTPSTMCEVRRGQTVSFAALPLWHWANQGVGFNPSATDGKPDPAPTAPDTIGQSNVVLQEGNWRVVADDLQWLLQDYLGNTWQTYGWCTSRNGLIVAWRNKSGTEPPSVLLAFPERFGREEALDQ